MVSLIDYEGKNVHLQLLRGGGLADPPYHPGYGPDLPMMSMSLRVPAKLLGSIIGQIISMSVPLGPLTQLMACG